MTSVSVTGNAPVKVGESHYTLSMDLSSIAEPHIVEHDDARLAAVKDEAYLYQPFHRKRKFQAWRISLLDGTGSTLRYIRIPSMAETAAAAAKMASGTASNLPS
jgi:hypothetical protein